MIAIALRRKALIHSMDCYAGPFLYLSEDCDEDSGAPETERALDRALECKSYMLYQQVVKYDNVNII